MRGFLRFSLHAFAAAVVLLLLGVICLPFAFLAPFALISIPFYPLFRLLMPEMLERRGY